jgi:hypothetical protein
MQDLRAAAICRDRFRHLSSRREAVMASLAIAFLILTALALQRFERGAFSDPTERHLLPWLFAVLWAAIVVEAIVGYWRCGDTSSWRSAGRLLLICLCPPFRLSVSTFPRGRCIWLPLMGWQIADRNFYDRLERAFSVPMLFIALMILPILAVEIFWSEYVALYPPLELALDLGTATIWFSFAVELIVMSALAEKKLLYLARHWLNLAIVLLPFMAFLRGLQITQLLRLGRLGKALKVYRLRGLGLRAWQGVLSLELIDRLLHRSFEARLRNLRARLADTERELDRLRGRIRALEAARSAREAGSSMTSDCS